MVTTAYLFVCKKKLLLCTDYVTQNKMELVHWLVLFPQGSSLRLNKTASMVWNAGIITIPCSG